MRKAADPKLPDASTSRLATAVKKASPAGKKASSAAKNASSAGRKSASAGKNREMAAAARVTLAAECVVRHGAALQAQLLATVSPTDEVIIQAAAVTRIDAAGLQLLVAFARREAGAGRRIRWEQPSRELVDSAVRVGLAGVLGLDTSAGAAS